MYITRLEDFRDIIGDDVYEALEKYIRINFDFRDTIRDLQSEISKLQSELDNNEIYEDDLGIRCENLESENDRLVGENDKLQKFYDYMFDLYGKGLEVVNWHLNGDLEAFDNFFDSADEVSQV